MIIVSRLNGERFGINAEHIERIEETPDTVLTLVEGRKYIVRESLEEVIERVVAYRARVLRVSYIPAEADDGDDPPLRLVQDSLSESADPGNGGN